MSDGKSVLRNIRMSGASSKKTWFKWEWEIFSMLRIVHIS